MDIVNAIILIIGAIGGPATFATLYKWAKAQGRAEALQEQSEKTIKALMVENGELKAENTRLLDALTRPQGR